MVARRNGRRRTETITADDTTLRHTALIYGPARIVSPCLRRLGIPSQYDPQRHAFKVARARLDDALVGLELDGYVVDVQQAAW